MSKESQQIQPLDRLYSLSTLARYTDLHRSTLRKRLRGIKPSTGSKGALLFTLRSALEARQDPLFEGYVDEVGRAQRNMDELVKSFGDTDDPTIPPMRVLADEVLAAIRKCQDALAWNQDRRW